MLKNITYKILWHFAWRLGYSIKEIEIPPKRNHGQDIRELPYLSDLPYTILNLPTELGVGFGFFSLKAHKIYHPLILALTMANNSDREENTFKVLKKYSELFSLKTPNDSMGFSEDEEFFSKQDHPYSFTYPWSSLDPCEVREKKISYNLIENKRYGLKTEDSLDLAGTSNEKVKIETKRILGIYDQIKTHGFKPQFPDSLGGFVLKHEENFKWYVQGGQHRAAVMAALGFEEIPVHVRQIIRREEVAFWPKVLSGLFSQEKALMIFDNMFKAELPPVAQAWREYVDHLYCQPAFTYQEVDGFDKDTL